jgi:hypothetical protein
VKKAAITFLFLVLNGTWALMTYLLHIARVRPAVIATMVAIGVLLGNLALYAGLKQRSFSPKAKLEFQTEATLASS